MQKKKTALLVTLMLCFFSLSQADAFQVTVSILPLKYFVEKIAGERVEVSVMVKPGASPATYEPTPRQMARLSQSKIYFAVGVPFENVWLEKFAAARPSMHIVHTDENIVKIPLAAHSHAAEDHSDEHHPGIQDPHIWLSPPLVRILSETIRDALISIDPAHAYQYRKNYLMWAREISTCDSRIISLLQDRAPGNNMFMVYHPSWGYFAKAYGLRQIPIEMEGKEPGPREFAEVLKLAKEKAIKVIFVQPQFSERSAQTVAGEISGTLVKADPLAYRWSENLVAVAGAFTSALR